MRPAPVPYRDLRILTCNRPLVEAEWDMVRRFVARMEREDLRLRFARPLNFGDEATLRRAFDVAAGAGEITWALDETAEIAAIAHRIRVSDVQAELGLIVRSDLKRRGIGEAVLRVILARAAADRVATLSATVLRENYATLRLAAKMGFQPRGFNPLMVDWAIDVGAVAATIRPHA
jgi:acetyltransferase